ARMLGISRESLRRKLKGNGTEAPQNDPGSPPPPSSRTPREAP
ncbi:MAG: hypothetical protein GYA47_04745, partial [Desulfovibrio sp.]|nr:hypothetical protein [Desulfovibrio sp.]